MMIVPVCVRCARNTYDARQQDADQCTVSTHDQSTMRQNEYERIGCHALLTVTRATMEDIGMDIMANVHCLEVQYRYETGLQEL
jgi:hypothetical protein